MRGPASGARSWRFARSVHAAYLLATSALFVVDSHYLPIYVIRRRPGTTIVQTWHACGAIKKIGYSVLDKSFGADEVMTNLVQLHTNYTSASPPPRRPWSSTWTRSASRPSYS